MKVPFRKHVAIAIDGGGIKGTMIARALLELEEHLGAPIHQRIGLAVGTSTGSIISAALGARMTAESMYALYRQLGPVIFRKTLRSTLWPLFRYRYPHDHLRAALAEQIGAGARMGDFWTGEAHSALDIIITAYDMATRRTRFIKPYKRENDYDRFPVVDAVLASCSVPTYFPTVNGLVDGGVGAYANPCFVAAYEITHLLALDPAQWPAEYLPLPVGWEPWDPRETTLISLGTGYHHHGMTADEADRLYAWQWAEVVVGIFMQESNRQQLYQVAKLFPDLDFRRFDVALKWDIAMDDASEAALVELERAGAELAGDIIANRTVWEKFDLPKPPPPSGADV
ncbi:MAG: patatin-like phospholipase family protein [Anaerolineae bacterium]|nr:patatin-like phospholipase family protein [Anaerolineae bacterium]